MGEEFVKITEDFLEEHEDITPYLVHDVKCTYIDNIQSRKFSHEMCLVDCESPIEQLLALSLEDIDIKNINLFNPFIDVLEIENQEEIECNGKIYRVDFLITVAYKNQSPIYQHEIIQFVIECDGYEFHQKTKEQVEKDNQRTRDLQSAGYEIIRFSGTEIWHKRWKCALEVLKIILSKCKYIKDKEV